jgi:hypothetical protein
MNKFLFYFSMQLKCALFHGKQVCFEAVTRTKSWNKIWWLRGRKSLPYGILPYIDYSMLSDHPQRALYQKNVLSDVHQLRAVGLRVIF